MKRTVAFLALLGCFAVQALAQYTPSEEALEIARLPLPAKLRSGAGVINWNVAGGITRYVESKNGMSCTVDNPSDDVVDIRCYNDQFWQVIARAREISLTARSGQGSDSLLTAEINSGRLSLPEGPTAGYRILDRDSGTITLDGPPSPTARKWQSVHFPFRTAEEMGLPTEREPNQEGMQSLVPFVMASGTWWSHVMIVHEPFSN